MRHKFNARQPRDRMGKWVRSNLGARKMGSVQTRKPHVPLPKQTANTPNGRGPFRAQVGGLGKGTGIAVGKKFLVPKGSNFTAPSPKVQKAKAPINHAARKQKTAVVPYGRANARGVTGGVNAGIPIGRKHRVVLGGYVRVGRNHASQSERQAAALLKAANPVAKTGLNRLSSKQVSIGKGATARIGTSGNGLPSVIVRKGYSKVSDKKRVKAVASYNKKITAGKKVKVPRPQRRKKNG